MKSTVSSGEETHIRTVARCYCGAVEVGFAHPPRGTIHCHCGECRRQSGAAFATWVSVTSPAVLQAEAGTLATSNPTVNTTRHFCKRCGTHLYTTDARQPEIVGVPAGAIVGQTVPAPAGHYFMDDKAPWHAITDGLPQYGGRSGFELITR